RIPHCPDLYVNGIVYIDSGGTCAGLRRKCDVPHPLPRGPGTLPTKKDPQLGMEMGKGAYCQNGQQTKGGRGEGNYPGPQLRWDPVTRQQSSYLVDLLVLCHHYLCRCLPVQVPYIQRL